MGRNNHGQKDLAAALGLSQASISDRLNGRRDWRYKELETVAALFGVTIDQLVPAQRTPGAAA